MKSDEHSVRVALRENSGEVLDALDSRVEVLHVARSTVEVVVEICGVFTPDRVGDVGEPDVDAFCAPGRISQRPVGEIMGSFGIDAAVEDEMYRARPRAGVIMLRRILASCGAGDLMWWVLAGLLTKFAD